MIYAIAYNLSITSLRIQISSRNETFLLLTDKNGEVRD